MNGCTATDEIIITVDDASSVEEELPWSVNIYPNPSNGVVTIEMNGTTLDQTVVNVFDVQGKLVKHPIVVNENEFSRTIDFSALTEGVYILNFTSGNESFNKRITILK